MSRLGSYTLLRRLAVGGMAEIFLARRDGPAGFSKVVALKRILPHLSTVSEFVSMFLDEARLAARLTHPHIVQIYDFGEVEGTYFISMEYVPGEDLLAAIKRARELERPVPPIVACSVLSAVCDALHYAHELRDEYGKPLGIVHRDVTPSNVLISFDGVVKLADFGIAKAEHRSTHTAVGALKGKYAYMSPEQARGAPLDRRSDVFSLGVVAHEMMTGRRLFARENELAVLKAITEEPIPRPSTVRPDLPLDLEGIIMKALSRDPERRFASAQAMQLAIEEHIAATGSTGARLHLAHYLKDLFGNDAAIARKRLAAGEVEDVEPTTAPASDAAVAAVVASSAGSAAPASSGPRARRRSGPRPAASTPLELPLVAEPALDLPLAAEPTATLAQHDYARALGSGGTMAHTHGEAAPRAFAAGDDVPILTRRPRRLLWLTAAGLALGVIAGAIWFTRRANQGHQARETASAPAPRTTAGPAPAPTAPATTAPATTAPATTAPATTAAAIPGPSTTTSMTTAPTPTPAVTPTPAPTAAPADPAPADPAPVAPKTDTPKTDAPKTDTPPPAKAKPAVAAVATKPKPVDRRRPKERRPDPPAPPKKGKLACDAEPWADVYIGSEKLGTTPLAPTALDEGTYTLRLRNPETKKEKKVRVTIKAGQVTRVKEKL